MISLEHPEMLFLIIPVIIVGFYLLRKTKTKLVEWRMLVAFLLVLALASPFTTVTQTISEEDPSLVLVQDQTSSMGLFPEEAGSELYKALVANTPTTLVQLTGDKTSLGDTIMQYAGSGNQIVLVSDGNSNAGKNLPEALDFAKETDTPVYLIQPELKANDLSVEVLGDKTVFVDNQNEFEIVVRQASNQSVSYFLEVFVDGQLSQSKDFTLEGRDNSDNPIPIRQTFNTLGAHSLRVKLTPHGEDHNKVNNEFFKSVYVIPKPKLTLVTSEPDSSLGKVLNKLYNVSVVSTYPGAAALKGSKVLVLDNQLISSFSEAQIREIKNYVSNGGGLVVVGGEKAYNYGGYLNSSLEEILPVLSKPSDTTGENYVILLLDLSGSTFRGGPEKVVIGGIETYPLYPILIDSARNIIKSDALKDSEVGIVVIGDHVGNVSSELRLLNPISERIFDRELSSLAPTNKLATTDLSKGILEAKNIFDKQAPPDVPKYIIIVADGVETEHPERVGSYYSSELVEFAKSVHEKNNINFVYIDIQSKYDTKKSVEALKSFMDEVNGEYIGNVTSVSGIQNIKSLGNEIPEKTEEPKEIPLPDYFGLRPYFSDHFITKNVNLTNANITGYNDVTPKAGAERLVITTTGKPVLTTWRFGLGRVAAFTTDNGEGEGSRWASALYNGSSAKLISGTTNWAIGNPRAEEGAVLDGPDTWLGTPSDLTLTMYDKGIPELKLDGSPLDLALTGRNTYEASVNPETIGIHDLSGYPLAVNYPLEYRDIGLNEDVESLILATGGKIYTEKDARALLLKDARQNSERQSDEPVSLKVYVLLAALVLYLGEIIARRIKEMNKLKNAQVEAETRV